MSDGLLMIMVFGDDDKNGALHFVNTPYKSGGSEALRASADRTPQNAIAKNNRTPTALRNTEESRR